ncbi:MAG: hypothetical protein ACI8W7_002403 [Gammaproteobacteria bacterium]|jgi:hypothetical protein
MFGPELFAVAIAAAQDTGLPGCLGCSVKCDAAGRLRSFSRPDLCAVQMFAAVDFDRIRAAGIMHSAARLTADALCRALALVAGRLVNERMPMSTKTAHNQGKQCDG